jgi:hypothetical protein
MTFLAPPVGAVGLGEVPLLGAGLLLVVLCGTAASPLAAASADNQCIACHTDVVKLKALTPPDPEPTEAGEG